MRVWMGAHLDLQSLTIQRWDLNAVGGGMVERAGRAVVGMLWREELSLREVGSKCEAFLPLHEVYLMDY